MSTTMNRADVEATVLRALAAAAPGTDTSTLDPKKPIREELDIDSMDFLNFVVALHGALGVDVPERDYAKLSTLDSCVDYLVARAETSSTS